MINAIHMIQEFRDDDGEPRSATVFSIETRRVGFSATSRALDPDEAREIAAILGRADRSTAPGDAAPAVDPWALIKTLIDQTREREDFLRMRDSSAKYAFWFTEEKMAEVDADYDLRVIKFPAASPIASPVVMLELVKKAP